MLVKTQKRRRRGVIDTRQNVFRGGYECVFDIRVPQGNGQKKGEKYVQEKVNFVVEKVGRGKKKSKYIMHMRAL